MDILSRRDFCLICVAIPLGVIAQLSGCASAFVFHAEVANGRAFVPFEQFNDETTAVVVKAKGMAHPVVVMRDDQGNYSAVSGRCTHQGCDIRPSGQFLKCPCHGSTFTRDGAVVRGPAKASLAPIPLEISAHGIKLLLTGR